MLLRQSRHCGLTFRAQLRAPHAKHPLLGGWVEGPAVLLLPDLLLWELSWVKSPLLASKA